LPACVISTPSPQPHDVLSWMADGAHVFRANVDPAFVVGRENCYSATRDAARLIFMHLAELVFFTQVVDGLVYGGWYRSMSSTELELLAVGLLERLPLTGEPPDLIAKARLEAFVRSRLKNGKPIPALGVAVADGNPPEVLLPHAQESGKTVGDLLH
jgi:hypothetical protein